MVSFIHISTPLFAVQAGHPIGSPWAILAMEIGKDP